MSRFEVGFGLLGLGLIAFGAALHPFTESLVATLLFLPTGTLLCIGVGLLQRGNHSLSPKVVAGLSLTVAGCLGIACLAYFTPEPFFGLLRTKRSYRPFLMPDWGVLFVFHLAWTLAAAVPTLGLRMVAQARIERSLAIGLSIFALYPTIVSICFLISFIVQGGGSASL